VPFIGGAQLLFYRSDLFEDSLIAADYLATAGRPLRPPRTWSEFNTVARFFTRGANRASPVEAGVSCAGIGKEEFCPEAYIRIWGSGGDLFDSRGRPCLRSENNVRAFESFLEVQQYTARSIFDTSLTGAVDEFCAGKSAMVITYTEFASTMMNAINNVSGKLGFTVVPGRRPLSIGWNLGLCPFSEKRESVLAFFRWLFRLDVQYYLTILDGASPAVSPYRNYVITKLYPWMPGILDNFRYAQKRSVSGADSGEKHLAVPWNRVEEVIFSEGRRIFSGANIAGSLEAADREINRLFGIYGA
jgi:multiple sugar transport system substrate-binding protein